LLFVAYFDKPIHEQKSQASRDLKLGISVKMMNEASEEAMAIANAFRAASVRFVSPW
jgi:hypothetical protein